MTAWWYDEVRRWHRAWAAIQDLYAIMHTILQAIAYGFEDFMLRTFG